MACSRGGLTAKLRALVGARACQPPLSLRRAIGLTILGQADTRKVTSEGAERMIAKLGQRVLIVGAHADDIEIGCGGTAHRLLNEGAEVTALVVTDTHYVRGDVVHRDSSLAQKEAKAAADTIGYQTYFGTARNNDVKVNSELVYFIRDYIEKLKADTIFTHWDGDAHLDHRNVASATIMATRDPRNLLMYRTNFYMSPEAFRPNLLVDITDNFETKMKALSCYRAELERNGDTYFDWVRHANRVSGATAGVGYAEEFQIVKYYLKSNPVSMQKE